jgi:lipopolysaccharide transport system ATP-binding protein
VSEANLLLKISQLNKFFNYYQRPLDRLRELFSRKSYHTQVHILNNIDLCLKKGESLAILGKNGAGKSTLLKMILGVSLYDSGDIQRFGRITGLLELGAGFDESLSGQENILINGQLLGMNREELQRKQDAIVQFAELSDYITQPIKSYSSGMKMRLGFSIAIHAEPDCFVIDEALAVGDIRFQQKCMHYLQQFQNNGGALLLVSHDLNQVKRLCKRAVILDQGQLAFQGEVKPICDHFQLFMLGQQSHTEQAQQDSELINNSIVLSSANWYYQERICTHLYAGQWASLRIQLAVKDLNPVLDQQLSLGFMIRDRLGVDVFGSSSHLQDYPLKLDQIGNYQITFPVRLNLGVGEYTLFLALHNKDNYEEDVQFWEQSYLNFHVIQKQQNSIGILHCDIEAPCLTLTTSA